jgi:23S rRNA pseudouridine2605 synthase
MPAAKKTAAKKTSVKKTVAKRTTGKKQPEAVEPEVIEASEEGAPEFTSLPKIEDPIGDETDGEAAISTSEAGVEAAAAVEAEPEIEAETAEDAEPVSEPEPDAEEDERADTRPPAKLERLQKIMAQAGIASRRAAEKLIEEGRVQVNGKVVTELGTKADGGRDHIRVDGKLLHGAERLRYFVLNKPRGFVTTVKDPEGRPTVMQFFEKMRERLYPVGRLDYLSEGLLLVTNDGELANRLTKASLGVEKTYLVKVAGVPTEEELDRLRAGVTIDKGAPGEGRVRTSPARIRQVRHGDNPWYEVVLVEGRNRELRKMFEEIGHFVEKIRRVGYGPLVLDQEPGNLRELDEHELTLLRKAADGTLKTAKAKSAVRVKFEDSLPPEKPAFRGREGKPGAWKKDGPARKPFGKRPFGGAAPLRRPAEPGAFRAEASEGRAFEAKPFGKPGEGRTFGAKAFDKRKPFGSGAPERKTFGAAKPGFERSGERPGQSAGARPAWKRDDRAGQGSAGRPPQRFGPGARDAGSSSEGDRPVRPFSSRPAEGRTFGKKPSFGKPFAGKPAEGRSFEAKPRIGGFGDKPAGRPFGAKPEGRSLGARDAGAGNSGGKAAWKKPADRAPGGFGRKAGGSDRPPFKRAFTPRPPAAREDDEPMSFEPRKPSRLRIEAIEGTERHEERRPEGFKPQGSGPRRSGPGGFRSERSGGPREFKPRPFTPRAESDRGGGRPSGGARFGRTSAGREGGGRSDSQRPFRAEGGLPRPFTTSSGQPRAGGPRPSSRPGKPAGAGWKPKPGGRPGGKPGFKSGPRPGGSGGFKGKSGGKPGGNRRG